MALLLSKEDVRKVLTMPDAIRIMEQAFAELARGTAVMPQRPVINVPEQQGLTAFMPALLPSLGAFAIKVVSVFKSNAARGLPSIHGVVAVLSPETGQVIAVMDGGYLTAVRTGAVTGVAAKYMARKNARVVLVFGAGVQARTQLEAVCAVHKLEKVLVHDVMPGAAKAYAQQMAGYNGIPKDIAVVTSVPEAVRAADIIVTATTSSTPIFDGHDVKPGTFVSGVGSHSPGARELDEVIVTRAKIVCDLTAACLVEAGDLMIPISEGKLRKEDIRGDLGDVILGKVRGRQNDQEITLFKSVGLAIQDASVALQVYRTAKEKGIGTEFSF